jgi:predicted transcriptional regulator
MSRPVDNHGWTFLTNHSQVLLCVARDSEIRLRDIAETVGITERAAQRILGDLVESGYVERVRVGRRNRYRVNREQTMRHAAQAGLEIGGLIDLLAD